jgi:signal transduction histidine kinase
MKRSHGVFRYLSILWVSGAAALALATWACFVLGLSSATAACVYLVVIVLLSLMDSFVTAVVFPVIAVGCLDFFFIAPLFAFEVSNPQDLTTLSAFLITSIVITSLVRRLRRLASVEDALRRIQETYLAEAQQLSHTGSFGWKVSSGEIFWSEEGFRIFGFDPTTRPSIELVLARVHPDELAVVRRVIDRAANDRRDFAFEHRLLLPGGTVKHVRVVARAMPGATANVDFVGAVMDVTSIRLAERELQNTRTELAHVMRVTSLGELTASIAHEVNQPLGAVVANAEACLGWLDRELPDLNEAHAAIERIIRDGHRAGEVIRRVRALIKRTDTQMAPVDINEIVCEAVNIVEHELLRYRVSTRMELSTDLPAVFGDRIQLQQVVLNLIINGIEAMQPITDRRRELFIRSQQDETQQVQLTVMDCGIGLSAENAHRIFDAFVTTKSSGMGMGLSICRSIIQAHGGRIWASSNEPFGAAVRFTLPLHRPEAP